MGTATGCVVAGPAAREEAQGVAVTAFSRDETTAATTRVALRVQQGRSEVAIFFFTSCPPLT